MQAQLIAPEYFVMGEKTGEQIPSVGEKVWVPTLDGISVLPLFTADESAWDFAETYYTEEDLTRPHIWSVNALTVASWMEEMEKGGLRAVVSDPVATSVGRWTGETMTVSYYRRFAAELSSGLEKLVAEAYANAGHEFGNPVDFSQVNAWCESRIKEVVEDAHARASEWETKDSS
jgi:hypothetical protein